MVTNIEELFADANAISTHDVSVAFDLSEVDVREWAEELNVSKIGSSFAWTRVDVEALDEQLGEADAGADDDENDEDGGDEEEDADADDDSDE
jgi:hypothetical protein